MNRNEYNGWTNYETWCVNLWMSNDQGADEYSREQAQEAYNNAKAERSFTREERATLDLADQLKDFHEEFMPDLGASVFSDLLGAAMSEVNWYEIAAHLIEDVDKEIEDDEEDDTDEESDEEEASDVQ